MDGTIPELFTPVPDDGATSGTAARLAVGFHSSPIPTAVLRPDGTYVSVNQALCRLLGRRPEHLVGHAFVDLVHPHDLDGYEHLTDRVRAGEVDAYAHAVRLAGGTGEWMWTELTVSTVRDAQSRVAWSVLHVLDQTLHRRAEEELHQFFTLADMAPDLILLADEDGTVRFVNRAGRALLGLDADVEVTALRLGDVVPADAPGGLGAHLQGAGGGLHGAWQGSTHLRHFGGGGELPVRASVIRLLDGDGSPAGVGMIAHDVSAQLRQERALARSEARLATLLANTADIVSIVDRRAGITFVNAAVRSRLGYEPEQVVGRPCMDLVHPDDAPDLYERLVSGLEGGVFGPPMEARFRHANGEWKWFDVLSSPLLDTPALQGAVINLRDASERKAAAAGAARRAALNSLAVEISRQALDVGLADLVEALPGMLAKVGELLDVGTCYIDRIDLPRQRIEPIATWYPAYRAPRPSGLPTDLRELPEWLGVLNRREPIVAEDLQRERPAWYVEKEHFTRLGTRAAIVSPLVAGGRLIGVLGVETANRSRAWLGEEVAFIQTVAEALANAMARQSAQDEIRASEERYRLLAEHATDLIVRQARDGTLLYASPAVHALLGYRSDEVMGKPLSAFVHPDDRADEATQRQAVLSGHSPGPLTIRLSRRDGSFVWTETTTMPVRDQSGAITELQSSTRNITDRKQREEELTRQALIDPLTGLANRVLLLERMAAADRRRHLDDTPFSVLLIDLDGFKEINDTFGHQVGDEVLITLANRITSLVRQSDTVSRLGGDEFVVLTSDSEPDTAMAVAERVVEVLSQPLQLPDGLAALGASVGVAHARGPHVNLEELLRDADDAMYRAKRAGKGRVREALR